MKTILTLIALISLGWALQLKFQEIPKIKLSYESEISEKEELESKITKLEEEESELNDKLSLLKESNLKLAEALKNKEKELPPTIIEIKEEKPKEDYSKQNSDITNKVAALNQQKELAKSEYETNLSQIEGFISKGNDLLAAHLKIKPEFKEGSIKTSEADRQKWHEQHKIREDFLKTEISKLQGQRENLRRGFNTFESGINLQIQQLEGQIK